MEQLQLNFDDPRDLELLRLQKQVNELLSRVMMLEIKLQAERAKPVLPYTPSYPTWPQPNWHQPIVTY